MKKTDRQRVRLRSPVGSSLRLALGTVCALSAGCGNDSTVGPALDGVIIPGTTKLIESSDFATHLVSMSEDGTTFVFTQGSRCIDNLRSGDVMVTDYGQGCLKKVSSVAATDGHVTVRTTQAALTDAVEQGSVVLSLSLSAADTAATLVNEAGVKLGPAQPGAEGFFLDLEGVVVYDEDENLSTTGDQVMLRGSLQIAPMLVFEITIRNGALERLVTTVSVIEEGSLTISSGGVSLEGSKNREICRAQLRPFIVSIGWVPVVITPTFAVDAGVDGVVSVAFESSVSHGAEFVAGARYEMREWQPEARESHQFSFTPPSIAADGQFQVHVRSELGFLVYGMPGMEVAVSRYSEVVADITADPWLALYAGIEAGVGVSVEALSPGVAGCYNPDLIDLRVMLWDSPAPALRDIVVTPASLGLTTRVGGRAEAILEIRNAGGAAVRVAATTDNQGWLGVSPVDFIVDPGSSRDVVVTADASALGAGAYAGVVTLESDDPGEATETVGVCLAVSSLIPLVPVSGGVFQMGSSAHWADPDEGPVHQVTVGSFFMSTYEVTQAEYQDVMGTNPSYFSGAERPVERVTWWNAALFCNALSVREGLTAFYNDSDLTAQGDTVRMDWSADGYRLPTEAEWEYACRAGTTTDFYSGSQSSSRQDQNMDLIGWYWFNSEWSPQDVGQKLPNALGLYDMSGNVAEWCNDRFGAYSAESQTDPHGPTFGASRLTRGGSWYNYPQVCRSANRDQYHPSQAYYTVGFRPARRQ